MSREQQNKRRQQWEAKGRQRRLERSLRRVLSTEEGRLVLQEIQEWAQIFQEFSVGSTLQVHYEMGRRSVGLQLRQLVLAIQPRILHQMEQEYLALPGEEDMRSPEPEDDDDDDAT